MGLALALISIIIGIVLGLIASIIVSNWLEKKKKSIDKTGKVILFLGLFFLLSLLFTVLSFFIGMAYLQYKL